MESNQKECLYCGKKILRVALKCKYCRRNLLPEAEKSLALYREGKMVESWKILNTVPNLRELIEEIPEFNTILNQMLVDLLKEEKSSPERITSVFNSISNRQIKITLNPEILSTLIGLVRFNITYLDKVIRFAFENGFLEDQTWQDKLLGALAEQINSLKIPVTMRNILSDVSRYFPLEGQFIRDLKILVYQRLKSIAEARHQVFRELKYHNLLHKMGVEQPVARREELTKIKKKRFKIYLTLGMITVFIVVITIFISNYIEDKNRKEQDRQLWSSISRQDNLASYERYISDKKWAEKRYAAFLSSARDKRDLLLKKITSLIDGIEVNMKKFEFGQIKSDIKAVKDLIGTSSAREYRSYFDSNKIIKRIFSRLEDFQKTMQFYQECQTRMQEQLKALDQSMEDATIKNTKKLLLQYAFNEQIRDIVGAYRTDLKNLTASEDNYVLRGGFRVYRRYFEFWVDPGENRELDYNDLVALIEQGRPVIKSFGDLRSSISTDLRLLISDTLDIAKKYKAKVAPVVNILSSVKYGMHKIYQLPRGYFRGVSSFQEKVKILTEKVKETSDYVKAQRGLVWGFSCRGLRDRLQKIIDYIQSMYGSVGYRLSIEGKTVKIDFY